MTRLPELRARLDTLTTPNAAEAAEIEELSRSVPKLIQQLPAVFSGRGDIRHEVALSEMISGLTERLDLIKPLAVSYASRDTSAKLTIILCCSLVSNCGRLKCQRL